MDLILFFISLLLLSILPRASSQTCSATTTSSSQAVNLFTSNPTVSIGGGTGTTLNLGPAAAPTATNTINIGGTGSTINIGAISAPTPTVYSPVTINGISPTSWFFANTFAPTPNNCGSGSTSITKTMWLPSSNINPRKGSPSPAPTTTAYVTTCTPTLVGASAPTISFSPAGSDCMVLPMAGNWKITLNTHLGSDATGSWWNIQLVNGLTSNAAEAASRVGYGTMSASQQQYASISRVVTVPTTSPVRTSVYYWGFINSNNVCSNGNPMSLSIEYLGPL